MTKNSVATTYTYDGWGRTLNTVRDGGRTEYAYRYGGGLVNVALPDSTEVAAVRGSLTPHRIRPKVSKPPHPTPLPGGEGANGLGQRVSGERDSGTNMVDYWTW